MLSILTRKYTYQAFMKIIKKEAEESKRLTERLKAQLQAAEDNIEKNNDQTSYLKQTQQRQLTRKQEEQEEKEKELFKKLLHDVGTTLWELHKKNKPLPNYITQDSLIQLFQTHTAYLENFNKRNLSTVTKLIGETPAEKEKWEAAKRDKLGLGKFIKQNTPKDPDDASYKSFKNNLETELLNSSSRIPSTVLLAIDLKVTQNSDLLQLITNLKLIIQSKQKEIQAIEKQLKTINNQNVDNSGNNNKLTRLNTRKKSIGDNITILENITTQFKTYQEAVAKDLIRKEKISALEHELSHQRGLNNLNPEIKKFITTTLQRQINTYKQDIPETLNVAALLSALRAAVKNNTPQKKSDLSFFKLKKSQQEIITKLLTEIDEKIRTDANSRELQNEIAEGKYDYSDITTNPYMYK